MSMKMKKKFMLTTTDNPWNPFDDYNEWFAYDTYLGYHTASYLARVVRSSDELSESQQDHAIEQGIDEIIAENVNGMYKKLTRMV